MVPVRPVVEEIRSRRTRASRRTSLAIWTRRPLRAMKTRAITTATATLAGVLLLAASAWALAPAGECESNELKTTGRYCSCRFGANARVAKIGGGTPSFGKCDAEFSTQWGRAQKRGMGRCPSSSDQAAIQAFGIQCTGGVATALAGGPLPTCSATQAWPQFLRHPVQSSADQGESSNSTTTVECLASRLN